MALFDLEVFTLNILSSLNTFLDWLACLNVDIVIDNMPFGFSTYRQYLVQKICRPRWRQAVFSLKGTDCYWSCFCCWSSSDLAPLTSPMCCTQEIMAKSSKADDCWFPGDHRQQIWVLFFPTQWTTTWGDYKIMSLLYPWTGVLMKTNNNTHCLFLYDRVIYITQLPFRFVLGSYCICDKPPHVYVP